MAFVFFFLQNKLLVGFPATEAWLRRNLAITDTAPAPAAAADQNGGGGQPPVTKHTITNAYLDLIDWDDANDFPELLEMDMQRLRELQARAVRLCACVSSMAVASGVGTLSQNPHLKKAFAQNVAIITEAWKAEADVTEGVENVWLEMRSTLVKYREEQQQGPIDEATEQTLKAQVMQLAKKESPVRSLMWKRLKIYLRLCLYSKQMPPAPPGFTEFVDELEALTTSFRVITSYNYAVFGDYYEETIERIRA